MSFDVDKKEFYETFDEMAADPKLGLEDAKAWAWSALEYAQDDKNTERATRERPEKQLTMLARFQVLAFSVYKWVRYLPRRMKYRYFPKHRITRTTLKNGDSKSSVPLAPGMWPEKLTWGLGESPVKHHGDGVRGAIILGRKEPCEVPEEPE